MISEIFDHADAAAGVANPFLPEHFSSEVVVPPVILMPFGVSECVGAGAQAHYGFTGIDVSPDELKTAAKRTQNLERNFNCRAGFSREDDTLPDRFFEEEIEVDGQMRSIDKTEQLGRMIGKFYEIRGWDEQGVPLDNTLN